MAEQDIRISLQNFIKKVSVQPSKESVLPTPDGKATYIPIDVVETQLDEYFFGLWKTENFRWTNCANEIVGSIDLIVFHPTAQVWISRTGAASIQVMVDAVPEAIKNNRQEKNKWALDLANKKAGALDMGFPKLKTECIKNAAQSIGNVFGRNLNRTHKDVFTPLIKQVEDKVDERIMLMISDCKTVFDLDNLKKNNPSIPQLSELIEKRKKELNA
jgi:hypothetical protein